MIRDETIDYTKTLEFLCHHLLAPSCSVVLTPRQFEVLKAYLAHIQAVGDGINFQLERCVDYRNSPHSAGYAVSWDNNGSRFEDDLVDTIMEDLVQNLGFDAAGSILRPGYIVGLDEIDGRIAEIYHRVRDRHPNADAENTQSDIEKVLAKTVFDIQRKP
ncbi:hypothetical protein U8C31_18185 [Sinorhizobium medicae]|uniref:hypothetical protein n=1 Tax=Sinorhizobium medicae TaxID=110321 RepID=UPI002AF6B43A|nr:hypothetical protein [Sinorhizobium medicae]WQO72166.1 hypothetical protein U8C31_18185 [Sinorhizobium medicae]